MKITKTQLRALVTEVLQEQTGVIKESKNSRTNPMKVIIREEMINLLESQKLTEADMLQEGKLKNFILSGLMALAGTFGASAQDAQIVTTTDTLNSAIALPALAQGDTIFIKGYSKEDIKFSRDNKGSRPQMAVRNSYQGQIKQGTMDALDKMLGAVVVKKESNKQLSGDERGAADNFGADDRPTQERVGTNLIIAKPSDKITQIKSALKGSSDNYVGRGERSDVDITQKIELSVPMNIVVKFVQ